MRLKRAENYRVIPLPAERRMSVDGGILARSRHFMHGLLEFDVTQPRRLIRAHMAATGERLSFTAYLITCLAKAVEEHKEVQALLDWRCRSIIFEDVNVSTMVEVDTPGGKAVMPLIIQAANQKSFRQIHQALREAKSGPERTGWKQFMRLFFRLPGFARRAIYRFIARVIPQYTHSFMAPVVLTAVGMFGSGGGWGLSQPYFPLSVVVGGISKKPWVVQDHIEIREILCITLSFDHDSIDGGLAARFAQRFRELVEAGYGLEEFAQCEWPEPAKLAIPRPVWKEIGR